MTDAQRRAVAELAPLAGLLTGIGQLFTAAGHELALVGGPVRDALLGRLSSSPEADLDFTTDARPEAVLALLDGFAETTWDVGIRFGTIGARIGGREVEITTYRAEQDDTESRNPQVDFGDSSSPTPTSEVQVITFDANWRAGDTFQVSLMGARSETITFAGDAGATDQAATASNIAQGIQKLWTVQAFTGVSCARTGALAYTVTFAGASADTYQVMGVTVVSKSNATTPAATVAQTTPGVSRKEPLWSATRGYPRTAEYFEGRLYFGGTRAKQQSLIGSSMLLSLHALDHLAVDCRHSLLLKHLDPLGDPPVVLL